MRAVLLEADESMLAERHRLGLDKKDEMWEGVLHVVPPPFRRHQEIEAALAVALQPAARGRGRRSHRRGDLRRCRRLPSP